MEGYTQSIRHIVKYPDCNATDNLFGGRMMEWMDEGAALYAGCVMKRDELVTRVVGAIEFKRPVPRGWVCTVYARTVREGRTSLTVEVLVTRTSRTQQVEQEVTRTEVVFVAVDAEGRATPWKTPEAE